MGKDKPYAGWFFTAAFSGPSPLSLAFAFVCQARFPLAPLSELTFQRCKIHFMLRAAALLPFLKELQRFSTSGRPLEPFPFLFLIMKPTRDDDKFRVRDPIN
jgi:hypothetical protein